MLKIVNPWDESEDSLGENEEDDPDFNTCVRGHRATGKVKKKNFVKIKVTKRKKPNTYKTEKASKKEIKRKKSCSWKYGHKKSFSTVGQDLEFKGDENLPEAFMDLETPSDFFKYFF